MIRTLKFEGIRDGATDKSNRNEVLHEIEQWLHDVTPVDAEITITVEVVG